MTHCMFSWCCNAQSPIGAHLGANWTAADKNILYQVYIRLIRYAQHKAGRTRGLPEFLRTLTISKTRSHGEVRFAVSERHKIESSLSESPW